MQSFSKVDSAAKGGSPNQCKRRGIDSKLGARILLEDQMVKLKNMSPGLEAMKLPNRSSGVGWHLLIDPCASLHVIKCSTSADQLMVVFVLVVMLRCDDDAADDDDDDADDDDCTHEYSTPIYCSTLVSAL